MVRHYHGTIEGVFWSFQDSFDLSNFKPANFIKPKPYYVYYGCNCIVNNMNEKYCIDCYYHYQNHYNNLDNDKDYIKDDFLAFECNSIRYIFDSNDIEFIENKLNEIENELGENIVYNLNFQIVETEYTINNNVLDLVNDDIKKLIARYCLGKQILYAINNGTCSIICDL